MCSAKRAGGRGEHERRHPSRYRDLWRSQKERRVLHPQPWLADGEEDGQFRLDPTTWHLYYGDETGRPGTALTFFAWGERPAGRNGNGMAVETAFIISAGSLGYWTQRLIEQGIAHDLPEQRFGERVLPFRDPDGMRLALVAIEGADQNPGLVERRRAG